MAKKISIVIDEKNKAVLIASAIAIVTFFLCAYIIKAHINQLYDIRSKISEETEKLVLIKDVSKLDNLLDRYSKRLYSAADKLALRDNVYILAREAEVDIISLQPLSPVVFGDFSKDSLRLQIRCSYNQLGNFIAKIESSLVFIAIDKISITDEDNQQSFAGDRKEESPYEEAVGEASLFISSYSFLK